MIIIKLISSIGIDEVIKEIDKDMNKIDNAKVDYLFNMEDFKEKYKDNVNLEIKEFISENQRVIIETFVSDKETKLSKSKIQNTIELTRSEHFQEMKNIMSGNEYQNAKEHRVIVFFIQIGGNLFLVYSDIRKMRFQKYIDFNYWSEFLNNWEKINSETIVNDVAIFEPTNTKQESKQLISFGKKGNKKNTTKFGELDKYELYERITFLLKDYAILSPTIKFDFNSIDINFNKKSNDFSNLIYFLIESIIVNKNVNYEGDNFLFLKKIANENEIKKLKKDLYHEIGNIIKNDIKEKTSEILNHIFDTSTKTTNEGTEDIDIINDIYYINWKQMRANFDEDEIYSNEVIEKFNENGEINENSLNNLIVLDGTLEKYGNLMQVLSFVSNEKEYFYKHGHFYKMDSNYFKMVEDRFLKRIGQIEISEEDFELKIPKIDELKIINNQKEFSFNKELAEINGIDLIDGVLINRIDGSNKKSLSIEVADLYKIDNEEKKKHFYHVKILGNTSNNLYLFSQSKKSSMFLENNINIRNILNPNDIKTTKYFDENSFNLEDKSKLLKVLNENTNYSIINYVIFIGSKIKIENQKKSYLFQQAFNDWSKNLGGIKHDYKIIFIEDKF